MRTNEPKTPRRILTGICELFFIFCPGAGTAMTPLMHKLMDKLFSPVQSSIQPTE
jgi:hypothetical protein